MTKRATKKQAVTAIQVEPKRPLTPAEEQLAHALAQIARRANLRIIRRDTQHIEAAAE